MEVVLALLVGIGLGWLLGRRSPTGVTDEAGTTRGSVRPTRKQRQILATLPVDPPRPTLEQLVAEELEETGAARIAGAADLQPHVALKVFRRDAPDLSGVPPEAMRFAVDDGVTPSDATVDQVRLVPERRT